MEERRTDILGEEVKIGDNVVIIEPSYHNFVNAKIIKFTPKGFRVKYKREYRNHSQETVVFALVKGKIITQ